MKKDENRKTVSTIDLEKELEIIERVLDQNTAINFRDFLNEPGVYTSRELKIARLAHEYGYWHGYEHSANLTVQILKIAKDSQCQP